MIWTVIRTFADALDGGHIYREGDEYPRAGYEPTPERATELASASNRLGDALIALREAPTAEPAAENEEPKRRGRRRKAAEE